MGDYVGVNLRAALSRIWCRCHGLFWWCPAARVAEPWVGMCRISSRSSRHRCSMLYIYFCDIWLCQYMQIIDYIITCPCSTHMHSIDRIDTHTYIYIHTYIHTYIHIHILFDLMCTRTHRYTHIYNYIQTYASPYIPGFLLQCPISWGERALLLDENRSATVKVVEAFCAAGPPAMVGDHGLSGYPFWYLLGKTLLLEIL